MNIRWIKWDELLEQAGILRNLDEDSNQIEAPEARRIAQAVNQAVAYAWKFHPWDGVCWVMRTLTGAPGFNILEPGYAVLECYTEDPLEAWDDERDPKTVRFRAAHGVLRTEEIDDDETLFYMVRTAPPRFGGEARDNAVTYAAGALVYDAATGECWRSTQTHVGTALPSTYPDWIVGEELLSNARRRRNGVIYTVDNAHTTEAANEPGYGVAWGEWLQAMHDWAPQRLPEFLLPAVLAGARSWLESADTTAMQMAMSGALEEEVRDYSFIRKQRRPKGGRATVL